MKRMLLLTAALVFAPGLAAHAGLIPTETSISSAGSGAFNWDYSINVPMATTAYSGIPSANPGTNGAAYVTIYDFAGFIPGSCVSPTGWGCSTQNTGLTPAGTAPTDDPNVTNITWSYLTGSPLLGDLTLSGFSAMSTSNVEASTAFTGTTTRSSGSAAGTTVADIGTTMGPTGDKETPTSNPTPPTTTGDAPSGVPEPAALGLLGTALVGLGFLRRQAGRSTSGSAIG